MTVNDFRRRLTLGLIDPAFFFMPKSASDQPEDSEALTFEAEVSAGEQISMSVYTPYHVSENGYFLPNGLTGFKEKNMVIYPPFDKRPKILFAMYNGFNAEDAYGDGAKTIQERKQFAFCIVTKITTEDGFEIDVTDCPDMFTDAPCNVNTDPWGISENPSSFDNWLISKNLFYKHKIGLKIDWGDGTLSDAELGSEPSISLRNHNGTTYKVYYYSGAWFKNSNHAYENAGKYTVKITGNCPFGLAPPSNMTRLISFGDLNYRDWSFFFNNVSKPIIIENYPSKNVSLNIVAATEMFSGKDLSNVDISFVKDMKNLVNAYEMFDNAKNVSVPDELFADKPYLSIAAEAFKNATISGNKIGSRLFYNCPLLFVIYDMFYNIRPAAEDSENKENNGIDIGESVFENCISLYCSSNVFYSVYIKNIGNNAFKNCTSLIALNSVITNDCNIPGGIKLGDGFFAGCIHMRNLNYAFNSYKLVNIPDNFLADVEPDDDYITAPLFLYNTFNSGGLGADCKDLRFYYGKNMLTSFLQKGGIVGIGSGWWYRYWEESVGNWNDPNHYSINHPLMTGEAPPFWEYPDNVYITDGRTAITVTEAKTHITTDSYGYIHWEFNYPYQSGCFGYAAGRSGNTVYEQSLLSNYAAIPKGKNPPDCMWIKDNLE